MPFDFHHASESHQRLRYQAAKCNITYCSILTCSKIHVYNMAEELFLYFIIIFRDQKSQTKRKHAVR